MADNILDASQSRFRPGHSTETALMVLKGYFLIAMNTGKISILVLLDLFAAFYIVGHKILLTCLRDVTGVDCCDNTFPAELRE